MRRSVCSLSSSQDSKEKLFVFKRSSHTPLSETDSSADGKNRDAEQIKFFMQIVYLSC